MSLFAAPQATHAEGAEVLESANADISAAEARVIAQTQVLKWRLSQGSR